MPKNISVYITLAMICAGIIVGYARLQGKTEENTSAIYELKAEAREISIVQRDIEVIKANQKNTNEKIDQLNNKVGKIFDILMKNMEKK